MRDLIVELVKYNMTYWKRRVHSSQCHIIHVIYRKSNIANKNTSRKKAELVNILIVYDYFISF
jgi:hypothetical protein